MSYAGQLIVATGDWQDYGVGGAAVLDASTTAPTQGNSTYTAQYLPIDDKVVKVRMRLTIGSTFAVGSGLYVFKTPPGYTASAASKGSLNGTIHISDAGTGYRIGIVNWLNSGMGGPYAFLNDGTSSGSILSDAGPFTAWNTNDVIVVNYEFEPA